MSNSLKTQSYKKNNKIGRATNVYNFKDINLKTQKDKFTTYMAFNTNYSTPRNKEIQKAGLKSIKSYLDRVYKKCIELRLKGNYDKFFKFYNEVTKEYERLSHI